jgi:hypothetical protein
MTAERDCDVLVVGGGAAGIAAGVAAARTLATLRPADSARVLLLEKYGFLGGLATAGMVGTLCGTYLREEGNAARFLCDGFVREWTERLAKACSSAPLHLFEGLRVLPYDAWAFQHLADELVRETPGLDLALHGTLCSVEAERGRVVEARALVWDRAVVLRPTVVVDCTGEATVVALAGGHVEDLASSQAVSAIFCMEGVETAFQGEPGRLSLLRDIARGIDDGRLPPACGRVSVVPANWRAAEGRICLKLTLPERAEADWNRMTQLELRARQLVEELRHFLVTTCPAFRHARLSHAAAQVGLRLGRRAKGRAVLTETDVLTCKKSAEGVARGAWPIEDWGQDGRAQLTYPPAADYYEIPMGCLLADGFDNVFVAGRCISASERALASARVIGTALGTGWAAGTAAAFRAARRPLSLAIQQVRKQMG